MQILLARTKSIISTLATREDLAQLEVRLPSAIQRVVSTLREEITSQTWLIVKWVFGLLVTLLLTLMAVTFYIDRYLN